MRNVGQVLILLASPLVIGVFDGAMAASRRATPAPAQQSTWNHNGSVVSLIAQGDKQKIVYQLPRVGLLDAGVKPGMVLFEGQRNKASFSGTAYMFYRTCKPQPYAVTGDINESASQITLKGKAPLLDLSCNNTGSRDDLLIFTAAPTNEAEQAVANQSAPAGAAKPPAINEAAKVANASAAPVVNAAIEKPGATPAETAADGGKKSDGAKAGDAKTATPNEAAKTPAATEQKTEKASAPPAEPPKAATESKTEKTAGPPNQAAKDEKQPPVNAQVAALPQNNPSANEPAKEPPPKAPAAGDKGLGGEKQKPQGAAAETAPPAEPQKDTKTAAIPPPAAAKSDDSGKSKNSASEKGMGAAAAAGAKDAAASSENKTPSLTGTEKMMEIVLKNGRILRVGRDIDLDALARLITMLERHE